MMLGYDMSDEIRLTYHKKIQVLTGIRSVCPPIGKFMTDRTVCAP